MKSLDTIPAIDAGLVQFLVAPNMVWLNAILGLVKVFVSQFGQVAELCYSYSNIILKRHCFRE
jgi:hypothetical protein